MPRDLLRALGGSVLFAGLASLAPLAFAACSGESRSFADDPDNFGDGGASADGTGTVDLLDSGCATAVATAEQLPVYMEIVVDGSGSMEGAKWTAAKAALDQIFDELATKADKAIGVGLIVFSDSLDPTSGPGPYPSNVDVPLAFVDAAQRDRLRARVDNATPTSGTPTFAGLGGAWKYMQDLVVPSSLPQGGRKVVVLVSDGAPDGGFAEQGQCKTGAATNLGLAAPKGPVRTFAIAVGDFPSDLEYFMGDLAVAGGTRSSPDCDPRESADESKTCHLQITPGSKTAAQLQAEFEKAINGVRAKAHDCTYLLDRKGPVDPTRVNVVFRNGQGSESLVPKDPTNGWSYDDEAAPTSVQLHGQACADVQADLAGQVRIVLGCQTVVH